MHNRRGRPTIRVLKEDLTTDWASPYPQRQLAAESYENLHPLSELPHPIVAKAAASFGADPGRDNYVGAIASATQLRLLEIRSSHWRGAVWVDPVSGVCWLVAAGLAKGQHKDHDDFYERLRRENELGNLNRWLPTDMDTRLLKRETAARLMTEWELNVQRLVMEALQVVHAGGSHRFAVHHPILVDTVLADIDLSVVRVRDDGYEADEIDLEFAPAQGRAGSNLLWELTTRVLTTLDPPVQGWDRFGDMYSNIGEPGFWTKRIDDLAILVEANELAVAQPGSDSHYVHREHLAGSTIEGRAVRSLCGVYFVPTQDHGSKPPCEICLARLSQLPE